jgi:hypothetical protein
MSATASRNAENREFLFRRIAGRPGGAKGALLTTAVLGRATANLQSITPAAEAEIERIVDRIAALAAERRSPAEIWGGAHDLRGLAGVFGLFEVGAVAGAIRWYGWDAGADFQPDWTFLEALAAMLVRALRVPDEMPLNLLAAACEDAVAGQMTREGRALADGVRLIG